MRCGPTRSDMVRLIAERGIADADVLAAMNVVPREEFVPDHARALAYQDRPLPIGAGQTISQPFIVARMLEALDLASGDRVLEVGAGCGYAAALMSRIVARVHAIERHDALSQSAKQVLSRLGFSNVEWRTGDGTRGWPEAAPFDAILVSAGGPAIPQALKQQLEIGGHLVMPVGERPHLQRLMQVQRVDATHFIEKDLGAVVFVPLIGEEGWDDAEEARP